MVTKILITLLGLTLVLAVACGGAAPPAPGATAAPVDEPTAAPVESEISQPTATPQVAVPPAQVEVNPGKLTIMVGDFGNERFDPAFTSGAGMANYAFIVHGFLISGNDKRDLVPGIASQWGLSADGLTWTFTIREGVKWHDGSELTPEDVLWTFQYTFGPQAHEYASRRGDNARISRDIDRIELSGADKVSLTTKRPATELALVISEPGAQVYPVVPKRSELHDIEGALAYDNNPIGAGPMKLVKHVQASVMTLERFDDFYYQPKNGFPEDKRVNFQSLDLLSVPEEATRVAAVRAGEADLAPVSLATKEQVEAGGGRVVFAPEGVVVQVKLRGCYEPQYPCHDKRVRQALHYAIDKELIRDQLYGGPEVFQVRGWHAVTPSTIGYTPELDPWPFDPDKARQLLADAGYPGGQGFGKLIVNTYPSTSMPFQVEAAQLAADLWRRELGLDVEVRVGDRTGNKERERVGEMSGQIYWRDNEARIDSASTISGNYANPEAADRLADDPEILGLVQETSNILDAVQRTEATKKLYQRLREENYELSIGYANIPWGVGSRVESWEPYPLAPFVTALHTITLK